MCGNYIDNVKAFIQQEKSVEKDLIVPDERLMRSIEKIDIPEGRKADLDVK